MNFTVGDVRGAIDGRTPEEFIQDEGYLHFALSRDDWEGKKLESFGKAVYRDYVSGGAPPMFKFPRTDGRRLGNRQTAMTTFHSLDVIDEPGAGDEAPWAHSLEPLEKWICNVVNKMFPDNSYERQCDVKGFSYFVAGDKYNSQRAHRMEFIERPETPQEEGEFFRVVLPVPNGRTCPQRNLCVLGVAEMNLSQETEEEGDGEEEDEQISEPDAFEESCLYVRPSENSPSRTRGYFDQRTLRLPLGTGVILSRGTRWAFQGDQVCSTFYFAFEVWKVRSKRTLSEQAASPNETTLSTPSSPVFDIRVPPYNGFTDDEIGVVVTETNARLMEVGWPSTCYFIEPQQQGGPSGIN